MVYVTEKEYYKAEDIFKSDNDINCVPVPLEEDKLSSAIADNNAFGCVIGVDVYKDQLYKSISMGGIIARFGVGHDGVDKQKATENSIIVTNTPGVLDDSVAEHAIFLMGTLSRNITRHDNDMKNNNWSPAVGSELKGKTLLILGCGPIGCKTAKIASFGFGMTVIGCDIADLDADQLQTQFGISKFTNNYNEVIGQADIISIHIPSLPTTRHTVNKEFLSKMKSSAYIINTSRGPVVDEKAIYDALKQNEIAGAGLDVFEEEPYEPVDSQKDLRSLYNVALTPHVGSSTKEACDRMALSCLINLKAAFDKKYDILNILNPKVINNCNKGIMRCKTNSEKRYWINR